MNGLDKKLLVIGKNSFLARRFLQLTLLNKQLITLSHHEFEDFCNYENITTILNFAIHPNYFTSSYNETNDFELKVAKMAAKKKIHYIMISSRMVYQPTSPGTLLTEESSLQPVTTYGKNKLITEKHLQELLGNQLTILRLANILGYEPFSKLEAHKSFIPTLVENLISLGKIIYDVNPFVKRDFITDICFIKILDLIINNVILGTYNIGSGIPLEIGRIALWVMEGYGSGELIINSPRMYDEFVFDIAKLKSIFHQTNTIKDIRNYCINLGKDLKNE